MITTNALRAVAAYNSTASLVDEGRIIADLQTDLAKLLEQPSLKDMTAANHLLSDAMGTLVIINDFMRAWHAETQEMGDTDQLKRINHQIHAIICHSVSARQALQIASSLVTYYEFEIIKHAKAEQAADDYSTATQDIQL